MKDLKSFNNEFLEKKLTKGSGFSPFHSNKKDSFNFLGDDIVKFFTDSKNWQIR